MGAPLAGIRVVEIASFVAVPACGALLADLDPETLLAERPELIVACLSGYGPLGERANDPAFDYTAFWALSGLMDHIRDLDAPPAFMRPGVGDHSAALSLSVGILAALRTRDAEGHGQIIHVALQQIGFYINGNDAAMTLATGDTPPRHDRRAPRNPLWNHYPCQDGRWLFLVMIDSQRYWPSFTRAIGRPELAEDPRFADPVWRYRSSRELVEILDAVFESRPLEKWIEPLSAERVIWAPMQTLAEAVEDPVAIENGSFATVEPPDCVPFRTVAPPLKMSAHSMSGSRPAPALGADTPDVLAEAGVDDGTIALLTAVVE